MATSEGTRSPRRRWRRTFLVAVIAAIVLSLVAYVGVSAYVYGQLGPVRAKCPVTEGFVDIQDPTSFTASTETKVRTGKIRHEVDTTPYLMPAPETVTFPARGESKITITASWEPATRLDAPTVVVVHGRNGCRRNSGNLLVAGMLHKHGIATLLVDMRNHGDSTVDGGQLAMGTDEYRDVLGAFDWLRSNGVPAHRIGLMGFSGGAVAAMIAMGEEPQVAAVWADSSWTSIREAFHDGLVARGLPTVFDVGAVGVGTFVHGHDVGAPTPLAATAKLGGRPLYLTQGAEDDYLSPTHLGKLAAGVTAAGGAVETWLVPGAGHTQAHFLYPAAYERRLAGFFEAALGA